MKNFTVDLKEEYGIHGGKLDCLTMDMPFDVDTPDWKRPALIVIPGGGYGMTSKREAEPVALAFLARGFQVFILWYTIGTAEGMSYPEQLIELGTAVDYVKKNADKLNVNKDEVFVVGFSAGGHLTGNLAVEYASVSEKAGQKLDAKPTAVGLCYPVISSKNGHLETYENLLYGYTQEAKAELIKTLNLNEAVTEETAPAFIWATAKDQVVPVDNAIRFAQALSEKNVDFELHVYTDGVHGLSTCDEEINPYGAHLARTSKWLDDCSAFFHRFTKEKF
ncbi:MAG: alpha/beta hydrolase [Clostridiales bacterium]|nr:alpha/beta hydrolase [Clostridiales bacterium]